MSPRYGVLSGCSGGGKSSLLEELRERSHAVIDEPSRRVVKAELERGGAALPWALLADNQPFRLTCLAYQRPQSLEHVARLEARLRRLD